MLLLRLPAFIVRWLRCWLLALRQQMNKPSAVLLVIAVISMGASAIIAHQELSRYSISSPAQDLLEGSSQELLQKLHHDEAAGQFVFNQQDLSADQNQDKKGASSFQSHTGDGKTETSLYSAELSERVTDGIEIYDTNLDLSFELAPKFSGKDGKLRGQHIVYPLDDGGQLVYTPKSNGFKEDIIYSEAPKNGEASYAYELNLPPTLEARELDTGGIGIYAANPVLYGDISFGSESDETRMQEARVNNEKNHLVFALPAPVVKATGEKQQATSNRRQGAEHARKQTKEVGSAEFQLEQTGSDPESSGTGQAVSDQDLPPQVAAAQNAQQKSRRYTLTLNAKGLSGVRGPISIDPSVVVSSSSEFGEGSSEYGIDFGPDEISRQGISGGVLDSWSNTSSMTAARRDLSSTVNNGYVYAVGGYDGTNPLSSVEYASINSDGSLGSWQTTSNLNSSRRWLQAITYNGYIYAIAGLDDTDNTLSSVEYAPINADGSLGSWQTTSSLNTARERHMSAAYNGYVYAVGGYDGTNPFSSVEYAPVRADGTLGTWQTTSSLGTARYTTKGLVAYNDYLYAVGGHDGSDPLASVEYASINSDGTLGSWQTTSSLGVSRFSSAVTARSGYIYAIAGDGGSGSIASVEYASIHDDGTLSSWQTTSSLIAARETQSVVAHQGYIYAMGGWDRSNDLSSVEYAQIHPDGYTTEYSETTLLPEYEFSCGALCTDTSRAHSSLTSVVYDGHIYMIGGREVESNDTLASVYYAPINSDGSLGSWTSTSSMNTARRAHASLAREGYVYAIGGCGSSCELASVEYAPINSDGTLGTWQTTSSLNTASWSSGAAAYNSHIYVTGGNNSGNALSRVEYAPINSDGTLGTWQTTSSLNTGRNYHGSAATNGYIYAAGGADDTDAIASVEYAPINSDGTLGTWQATSSLTTVRERIRTVIYNGYIYVLGGLDGGSTSYSSTEYAPINSDGALGSWSANQNLTVARNSHAVSLSSKGYMYAVGGSDNDDGTVEYTRINNGGPGTMNSWTNSSSLNTGRDSHGSVVYKDYVYTVGGHDGNNTLSSVEYAPINADGSLGSWSTTSSLNTARYLHSVAISGDYIYAMSGHDGSNVLSDVEYAPINADGSLGSWNTTNGVSRFAHASITYNDYMYVVGGSVGSGDMTDISYAPINSDGTIGSWQSTSNLNVPRVYLTAETANGHMYAIAGQSDDNNENAIASVEYAPINADGTLDTWQMTSSLNTPREFLISEVSNGYMYAMTGVNDNDIIDETVEYAPIHASGGVGGWRATTSLGTARQLSSSVVHNGRIYAIGGYTGSFLASTEYTSLNSIVRTGRYSKLIDFGAESEFESLGFSGNVLGGKGLDISYQLACKDTEFISPSTTLREVPPDATQTVGEVARYVLLTLHLDDGNAAVFPDSQSSVSSFTLDYVPFRSEPEDRLRLGNFFANENEQPYDTLEETEESTGGACG